MKIDRNNLVLGCSVGDYTYTGPFDMMFRTKVGKFCSIAYGVTIAPPEHDYTRVSTHPFIYRGYGYRLLDEADLLDNDKYEKPSCIGNDVWIGCNATVLRGAAVGDGAVIAANALVNGDVPPYAIVAGVPARVVGRRFGQEVVDKLLELKWWDWPEERIRENGWLFRKAGISAADLESVH